MEIIVDIKFNKLVFYLLHFLLFGPAIWSQNDHWDPQHYRENCGMQKRWAYNMINAFNFDDASESADVRCGRGEITATIANQHPNAGVIGIDISKKMIEYASKEYASQKNLQFVVRDAHDLRYRRRFDVVTSFSTMHRLKDPGAATREIFQSLRPGGLFMAAFPAEGSIVMSKAIARIDSSEAWKPYFSAHDRKEYAFSTEMVKKWLVDAGFMVIKLQIIRDDELFESRDRFRNTLLSTSSYKEDLPPKKVDIFFDQIVSEYCQTMPIDHEGRIHFYFSRMEVIAVRPKANL